MYDLSFRKHVLLIGKKEGLTIKELSHRFAISIRSIVNWKKKLEPIKKRNKKATKINMDNLRKDIEKYNDSYNYERAARLKVSTSCIYYALKRLKVTYKKNSGTSQSESRKARYFLPKAQKISRSR